MEASMADTAIKRVGGKVKMASWIKEKLPPHSVYVEPFGGSFAVGMQMPRPDGSNYRMVYNDLDGHIWNFFRIIREQPEALMQALEVTPYGRKEFNEAVKFIKSKDIALWESNAVEWARNYIIYNRQSIFGKETGNWCISRQGENICMTWHDLPECLQTMAKHLKTVYVECLDYRKILQKWDSKQSLFYIDPPYEGVEKDFYPVNKTDGFSHEDLRKSLDEVEGSWAVSYYDSPEIRKLYQGFKFYELSVKKHMQTTTKKTTALEVLIVKESKWSVEAYPDCFEEND
jgi:DNA adenine methylase